MYCYPYLELANKFNSILIHYRPIIPLCHAYSHWSVCLFLCYPLSLSLCLPLYFASDLCYVCGKPINQ